LSRQNWDEEEFDEGYDAPLFIFPDDEDDIQYDRAPVASDSKAAKADSGQDDGISAVPSGSGDVEYDVRRSESITESEPWGSPGGSTLRRRSGSNAPVEYPEGSLGAFSTPEDYEGHTSAVSDEPEDDEPEYDAPIFLFPPDEVEDDDYDVRAASSSRGKGSSGRRSTRSDDGDLDDSIGISFSRYSAENKEGEFFFMPFLDIPDEVEEEEEEEGEEVSFSFRKVDAEQVKKEKEFIFMPFLNTSEDAEDDDDDDEPEDHHARRSSKGVIFDEGLYLIPLESEEEEEPEPEDKEEEPEEEDSGIYVVSSVGGVVPTAPKIQRTEERKTTLRSDNPPSSAPQKKKKKKAPPKPGAASSGKKQPQKKGAATVGKNATAEEQFRAAMRNVSPEIRAAVKNDPVQRAALEQAVRIALVQQAAQEAVEKATGRPVFGGSSAAASGAKKKKRIPKPPQRQSQKPLDSFLGGSSRARSMSFSPITLRTAYDDGGVSEFGVTEEPKTPAAETGAPVQNAANTAGMPDSNQDPVLSLIGASGQVAQTQNAEETAESILEALGGKTTPKQRAAYQSPAAVRAAMRTGMDFDSLQTAPAPAAPKATVSAAEQEMQAKRSGCLIWIIVAFVVFFVSLIAILIIPNISKQNNYDEAISLMNSGRYLQAIEIFETFKSTDTKYYNDSRLYISDCAYKQANQYFADGKYYEAYNLLIDKATVNEQTTALALMSNYYYAEQRYAQGDWQTAVSAYANLLEADYEDSRDKYNICQYQLASKNAEDGKYLQAYQGFTLLGDYSDARYRSACMICKAWETDYSSVTSARLIEAVNILNENLSNGEAMDILNSVYNKAMEYRNAGEHIIAYDSFYALGDYSDSSYRAALSLYGAWNIDPGYGTLHRRQEAMDELYSRRNNDEAEAALNSAGFNPVRLLGEWSDGVSTMSLQRVDENSDDLRLVMNLVSGTGAAVNVDSTSIGFDGNVVYRLTEPGNSSSKELLFEVTGFENLADPQPGSFSFRCFLDSSEYTLERE